MKSGVAKLISILNIIGFLGTVVVNSLANALPINGLNTGQLSDMYPNLFVPAGITFSIWGVIYILLAIFVIYQAIVVFGKNAGQSQFTKKTGFLFLITCIANIGWIFAWHYQMVALSLLLMLVLLLTLIAILLRLNIGNSDAGNKEKYMVHLPFSVYLGWITIATVANVTALLVSINWNGFGLGAQFWTVFMILIGLAITLVMLIQRKDIFYALVVDWAVLGILIKRLSNSDEPAQSVIIVTIISMVVITATVIAQIIRKKVY
jgi:hypothetical protein